MKCTTVTCNAGVFGTNDSSVYGCSGICTGICSIFCMREKQYCMCYEISSVLYKIAVLWLTNMYSTFVLDSSAVNKSIIILSYIHLV